jgi:SAM-dependent MidA family methyltransferase
VHSAADDIRRAIAARAGAIRFDEFMAMALYGEHGFYTHDIARADSSGSSRTGRAGRRGDFLTSPETGPLFGAVLARAIDQWWDELGRPDPFVVVDAGAGPGTLARAIHAAHPACADAMRYRTIEISTAQRSLHPTWVESFREFPAETFSGVVIANELLDNLPFRLFVFDDGWREAYVDNDNGRFVERLRDTSTTPPCLPRIGAHGARVAVQESATQWVEAVLGRLEKGRLVIFDYCTSTASMASRPWREWLRTYSSHERGQHFLSDVGLQDITVEVALDQLPRPTSVMTQASFLREFGIENLVSEGRAAWESAASQPDVAAMTMRSRIREAEALLDPTGLGGFSVVEWCR